jgi:hypothetical protein
MDLEENGHDWFLPGESEINREMTVRIAVLHTRIDPGTFCM